MENPPWMIALSSYVVPYQLSMYSLAVGCGLVSTFAVLPW